jgi:hypothetical protein
MKGAKERAPTSCQQNRDVETEVNEMRIRKTVRWVVWVAGLASLLVCALSFMVSAQSGQTQQQPPLKGGVSQTVPQQPTNDTYNSQGADSDYACFDAAECFQVLMDDTQRAIARAMSTRDPAWHKPESCARNRVWQNLNPSLCWQYLIRARKLAEQNESVNSRSLQIQAQAAIDQAHQCFDPIYRRWGELGGSYNDLNWNCGKGFPLSPQPPTEPTNTKPTSSSVGTGALCGKWSSAIVQSCARGGPDSHGSLPGTGGISGAVCILCFWTDANGYPATHPQIIPSTGFIKSSFDPPGAALKECADKLTPGWIADGKLLCPTSNPAGKDITYSPGPRTTPEPLKGVDSSRLARAVDKCLSSRVPYYRSPEQTLVNTNSREYQAADPYWKVFYLAVPYAENALNLREQKYGPQDPVRRSLARHYLSGLIFGCIEDGNLMSFYPFGENPASNYPDPRQAYAAFLHEPYIPPSKNMKAFEEGHDYRNQPPLPLLPPSTGKRGDPWKVGPAKDGDWWQPPDK